MTVDELDSAMMRDIQLHEEVRVWYDVTGWVASYSFDDGNTEQKFHAESPIEALKLCFSEIRNKRGRT